MSLQSLDRVLSKTSDRSVGDLIATYGSNVQRLKMDAATGKIDPTKAVMAMMAIQRIVAANTQPPSGTTVAQDTGIAPPPQQMGMNAITPSVTPVAPAAPQQPPMRMAYGGQVAVSNNQVPSPAMERGLSGLPVPDNMFDYAEGGMIAFGDGGNVKRFQAAGAVNLPYSGTYPVGPNPVFPSGSSLSYGSGVNPTGSNFMRMPPTFDYRIAPAAPPGTPAVLQNPLSRINPTGYRQFAEQIAKLAPYLDEMALEKLYQQTAGNVSKAINVLKSLGPAAGLGVASLGVEQATGLSPEQQMVRGIRATNPVMGSLMSLAEQIGLVKPVPTEKQKAAQIAASQPVSGRERGQEGYVNPLVEEAGKEQTEPPRDTKAEEKAAMDTAVSEARKIIGPALSIGVPKIAMPAEPKRMVVPQEKDIDVETEAARGLASRLVPMPVDADKSFDQILKSDRETLANQGYDFNMIKNLVAEKRVDMEKIPEQRKEAANLRLLEAGLAIMGGTSPYAFVNIGKGGSEAAKGFNEDMKEFRKLDREYRKELQQLQVMQNQETFMLTTEGRKRYERIQDKVEQSKLKRAEVAFSIGRDAVKNSIEDRRTAETANAALERTIYAQQAEINKAQAQIQGQVNIASAQNQTQRDVAAGQIGALGMNERLKQERENRMIDQIMADAKTAGKLITRSEAFEILKQMETGLGAYRAAQNETAKQRIRALVVSKIDEPTLRINIAKGMGLKSAPPPGANAAFDNKVKEEYEKIIQRAMQANAGGTETSDFSGYKLLSSE